MSKIVVLVGSMRKGGNTDLLAQAFTEGAISFTWRILLASCVVIILYSNPVLLLKNVSTSITSEPASYDSN